MPIQIFPSRWHFWVLQYNNSRGNALCIESISRGKEKNLKIWLSVGWKAGRLTDWKFIEYRSEIRHKEQLISCTVCTVVRTKNTIPQSRASRSLFLLPHPLFSYWMTGSEKLGLRIRRHETHFYQLGAPLGSHTIRSMSGAALSDPN